MNGDLINEIVRCAFKLCLIYFLKCFLPSVNLGSYVGVCASTDYDKELRDQILVMRRFFIKDRDDEKHEAKKCDVKKCDTREDDQEFTRTKGHDNAVKESAMNEIKQNITEQLKEKYGDNICVDFACDDAPKDKKMLYALKIKEIGRCDPKEGDFCESDIYVNTESKQFYVKTKSGFHTYPLLKRSVVKCEKTD